MKREFDDFILFAEKGLSSAQTVKKYLGVELFHERSGKPRVEGAKISLSDTCGVTLLAVLKGEGEIGVDAEKTDRESPAPLKDIFAWTRLEAYCKALGRGITPHDVKNLTPRGIVAEEEIDGLAVSVCVLRPEWRL